MVRLLLLLLPLTVATASVAPAAGPTFDPIAFDETVAARLEILWPSGIRQALEEVPADQLLTVREPAE